jgi:hypothetical protein
MMTTLNLQERLRDIEALLPQLDQRADAEAALICAKGDSGPLAGACQERDELRQEASDIRLKLRGHEISTALDELTRLDAELAEAMERREAADREVLRQAESPIVERWNAAPTFAIRCGYGHSWELFSQWFLSGRPRYIAAPECLLFFQSGECSEPLRFDLDGDRECILAYHAARDEAVRASMAWTGLADRRTRLLREHPELCMRPT